MYIMKKMTDWEDLESVENLNALNADEFFTQVKSAFKDVDFSDTTACFVGVYLGPEKFKEICKSSKLRDWQRNAINHANAIRFDGVTAQHQEFTFGDSMIISGCYIKKSTHDAVNEFALYKVVAEGS